MFLLDSQCQVSHAFVPNKDFPELSKSYIVGVNEYIIKNMNMP